MLEVLHKIMNFFKPPDVDSENAESECYGIDVDKCPYCGKVHGVKCPLVKTIEYFPDGAVKQVVFYTLTERQFPTIAPFQHMDFP